MKPQRKALTLRGCVKFLNEFPRDFLKKGIINWQLIQNLSCLLISYFQARILVHGIVETDNSSVRSIRHRVPHRRRSSVDRVEPNSEAKFYVVFVGDAGNLFLEK